MVLLRLLDQSRKSYKSRGPSTAAIVQLLTYFSSQWTRYRNNCIANETQHFSRMPYSSIHWIPEIISDYFPKQH